MAFEFLAGLGSKIGSALKGVGSGFSAPSKAATSSSKIGSFLRYMLDDDARNIASAKSSGMPFKMDDGKVSYYSKDYLDALSGNESLSGLLKTGDAKSEEEKTLDDRTKRKDSLKVLKDVLSKLYYEKEGVIPGNAKLIGKAASEAPGQIADLLRSGKQYLFGK